MIIIIFLSAVTLHRPWPSISFLFLVLGSFFFTDKMFLVEISLLFLEITGHLLVTYNAEHQCDCSIREYQSIVATITSHQALSPGLNQWLSMSSHHIIIKMAYL